MQKLLAEVLAAWRRAERLTAELEAGTTEHAVAAAASERLREAFHLLVDSGVATPLTDEQAKALVPGLAEDLGPIQ